MLAIDEDGGAGGVGSGVVLVVPLVVVPPLLAKPRLGVGGGVAVAVSGVDGAVEAAAVVVLVEGVFAAGAGVDGIAMAVLAVVLAVPLAFALAVTPAAPEGVPAAKAALPLAIAARFSAATVADSWLFSWLVAWASWVFSAASFFRPTRAVRT